MGLIAELRQRRHRDEIYNTADYWDGKTENFEGSAVAMWPNQALNERYHAEQMAMLLEALGPLRGRRVLDVGCGTGRVARRLAQGGAEVVGLDFAAGMISQARALTTSSEITYRQQSVFDLEEESAYDAAVSWGVLTVACSGRADVERAVRALTRAVRMGGELLFMEPLHTGFLHRVLRMSPAQFCEELEGQGLTVKRRVPLHFWPTRLLLAYAPWPAGITAVTEAAGRKFMTSALRNRRGGDYTFIHTVRGATGS